MEQILTGLSSALREEDVKHYYRELIKGEQGWSYIEGSDGVWNNILFEFKHDLKSSKFQTAKAIAQGCYYMKKGSSVSHLVVADKGTAYLYTAQSLIDTYNKVRSIDWSKPASDPDRYLIGLVRNIKPYTTYDMTQLEGIKELKQELRDIVMVKLGL